jgi:hypothetical protein
VQTVDLELAFFDFFVQFIIKNRYIPQSAFLRKIFLWTRLSFA